MPLKQDNAHLYAVGIGLYQEARVDPGFKLGDKGASLPIIM